jgi:hypothetical protein
MRRGLIFFICALLMFTSSFSVMANTDMPDQGSDSDGGSYMDPDTSSDPGPDSTDSGDSWDSSGSDDSCGGLVLF